MVRNYCCGRALCSCTRLFNLPSVSHAWTWHWSVARGNYRVSCNDISAFGTLPPCCCRCSFLFVAFSTSIYATYFLACDTEPSRLVLLLPQCVVCSPLSLLDKLDKAVMLIMVKCNLYSYTKAEWPDLFISKKKKKMVYLLGLHPRTQILVIRLKNFSWLEMASWNVKELDCKHLFLFFTVMAVALLKRFSCTMIAATSVKLTSVHCFSFIYIYVLLLSIR